MLQITQVKVNRLLNTFHTSSANPYKKTEGAENDYNYMTGTLSVTNITNLFQHLLHFIN